MSRADLFDAAKQRLGIKLDVELAKTLGVGRSFLCLVKNGTKNMPESMVDKIASLTGMDHIKILTLIKKGTEDADRTLPPLSLVQRPVQHESGVLPDTAPDDSASAPAGRHDHSDQGEGGEGRSEPADLTGQSGKDPVPQVAGRTRLKRGTRAAVVLKVGSIYYPAKASDHTHRRVIGLVRQEGKKTAVVYSFGGDHNGVCTRDTFVRWMDPTKDVHGQPEIRLDGPSAGAHQPQQPQAKGKRHSAGKDKPVASAAAVPA